MIVKRSLKSQYMNSNLMVLFFASLLSVACSNKKIVISGQVVDASGLPIQRAEVVTTPPTDIVTTDAKGFFYLTRQIVPGTGQTVDIKPDIYQVQITRERYEPLRFSVKAEKGNVWAEKQTMQPEQSSVTSVKPESEEEEYVPTGGGGMVGF